MINTNAVYTRLHPLPNVMRCQTIATSWTVITLSCPLKLAVTWLGFRMHGEYVVCCNHTTVIAMRAHSNRYC